MKLPYIINFNWRTKLKQIKTYIITIRTRKKNSKCKDWSEICEKTVALTSACASRREKRGENFQTTITPSTTTVWLHAPHLWQEDIDENHSRRRLGIFGRWNTPHAPPEQRVNVENVWRVRRRACNKSAEKIKKRVNLRGSPLTAERDFVVLWG